MNRTEIVQSLLAQVEGNFTIDDLLAKAGDIRIVRHQVSIAVDVLTARGEIETVAPGKRGKPRIMRKGTVQPQVKSNVGPNQREIECAKCGETKIIGKHNPSLHCYDCQKVECFRCKTIFKPNAVTITAARVYCSKCRKQRTQYDSAML